MKHRRLSRVAILATIAVALAVALPSTAWAAITSPVPSGTNPGNVAKGAVSVQDDYFNAANTAQNCTNGFVQGNVQSKGITTVQITQNSTNAVVLKNSFSNTAKGTFIALLGGSAFDFNGMTSSLAATWTTDAATITPNGAVPRGAYTIKTTYFKRAATTGACGASTSCAASTPAGFGTLTNGFLSCAPAAAIGAAETQPASTQVVDIENKYALALSNAPASGPYLTADTGPTTATIQARLTDPGRSATNPPGVNGKVITFTVAGKPGGGNQVLTATTAPKVAGSTAAADQGFASVTFDMTGWSFGSHALTVTGEPDNAFFLHPDPATNAIKFGGASVTSYTGATSAYWHDVLPVSAHVQAVQVGGGTPADGAVKFTLGTGANAIVQTVNSVNGLGNAATSFTLPANGFDPPSTPLKVEYAGSSDGAFNPSTVTQTIAINKRPTSIVYNGGTHARYGDDVTFAADLKDITPGSALNGTGLGGFPVTFQISGGAPVSTTTDPSGHASVTVPMFGNVGPYTVTATYAGDTHYVGSSDTKPVSIDFRYTFKDINSPNYIDLNPGTLQFDIRHPNNSTGIVSTPTMFSIFLPTHFYFALPELPTVPANILMEQLNSVPGNKPAVLQPHISLSVGTLETPMSRDPATNPIPIGGFTIGDLINKIATGHYPTDLDTCQVLTGATCERRLVVVTDIVNGRRLPAGVFDVKTGLFVALVASQPTNLYYSFGNCLNDVVACAGLPLDGVIAVGPLPTVGAVPPVTPVP